MSTNSTYGKPNPADLGKYIPAKNPYNIPAKKQYVFNETGNVMMSTTDFANSQIEESVRQCFAEVQVFFAAMTKALENNAINYYNSKGLTKANAAPKDGRKSPFFYWHPTPSPSVPSGTGAVAPAKGNLVKKNFSLYDYQNLKRVIDESGCFIQVNEEDMNVTTEQFGANFSKELLEAVLGLATGGGELAFAQAMVNSIGEAGFNLGFQSDKQDTRVGNIIFVCEYLMGMPVISAIVITACSVENAETFQLGPCFKESNVHTNLKIHKDTYTFVTPSFIKQYSPDIISGITDTQFGELVKIFQNYLSTPN
jgi:hypothetical protein|tara:strand:+ start:1 stop:930 length:930 start_codon:yes stop_codon:yes gene_type:complete